MSRKISLPIPINNKVHLDFEKPLINYNKSAHQQNLTRLIMTNFDTYESSMSMLKVLETLSPEPRIYKYSINKNLDQKQKV